MSWLLFLARWMCKQSPRRARGVLYRDRGSVCSTCVWARSASECSIGCTDWKAVTQAECLLEGSEPELEGISSCLYTRGDPAPILHGRFEP